MKTLQLPILVLAILLVGCQSAKKDDEKKIAVNDTYEMFCSSCHGKQLQRFKVLNTKEKDLDYIKGTIVKGKLSVGMPPFGSSLNEEQVSSLAEFIKEYDYSDNNISSVDSTNRPYRLETVVDDLEVPWGLEFLPDGDLLISERKGSLIRYSKSMGKTEINGIPPVLAVGQGGLLDIKLHPNYAENGWLYIAYSYISVKDTSSGNTAIIRAKLEDGALTNIEELYKGTHANNTNRHYGSRIVFDSEGFLYFSNGDKAQRDDFPQSLDNTNGKIHRLHDDGRVPADNPFVDQEGAIASIYSYGHRNPQGLAIHPFTGDIWECEHGPKGGDEINIIRKGLNYGWPIISYGINYDGTNFTEITEKEGMEQPIHYYVPSIATCGMAFVDSKIYPGWESNLLIGSLNSNYLERLELNGNKVIYQEKLLEELDSRVRNVKMGPDGYIYVSVEEPGRILKLLPSQNPQ
ncbi:MAG: PQQ-dependent sugar dehydrogenase [Cyclobacteriaceae bacterium]